MSAHEPRLIGTGIYTIPEAAFLVEASPRLVRTWVEGRGGKVKQAPLIENQVGRIGRIVAISFTNLMELRFAATFANAGVRLNEIRKVMDEVKRSLQHPHPFATRSVFRTDGYRIFEQIARKNKFEILYDLRNRQYELLPVVIKSLRDDVIWDPSGEAVAWYPRRKKAPNVIIHPSHSFGHPVLKGSLIPTETLAKAVEVEGSATTVANFYDVPVPQVREAVSFEKHLRMAA